MRTMPYGLNDLFCVSRAGKVQLGTLHELSDMIGLDKSDLYVVRLRERHAPQLVTARPDWLGTGRWLIQPAA